MPPTQHVQPVFILVSPPSPHAGLPQAILEDAIGVEGQAAVGSAAHTLQLAHITSCLHKEVVSARRVQSLPHGEEVGERGTLTVLEWELTGKKTNGRPSTSWFQSVPSISSDSLHSFTPSPSNPSVYLEGGKGTL